MNRQGRAAGPFEVWAARAWNVFNEGRPFGIVYPPMALAGAWLIGAAPEGSLALGLATGLGISAVWARFSFPLRSRALLWVLLGPALVVLEAWRAPGLLAVAIGGWLFFTVFFWGSLYYHLRTGAPWTNFRRFWRLVATNSDPTSGNALEQVPKLLITLSAVALVAEEPAAWPRAAAVAAVSVVLGALAWRWFCHTRLPVYPERGLREPVRPALADRVYVIVIDGANRERLRQASALGLTPTIDRLTRGGTEYLDVQTAYPARTVVCFSSMLTGATPAEHGMRSNFAPRLGVRVPSLFDVLRDSGKKGRLVGIAHLLDPFGEEDVRSVTSVQPTERIDHSLCAAAREVVEGEDPDLLVLQLLAADQLGHVRGTRNPEYLQQLAETDRRIDELLAFLGDRLDGATVILMADHGQGRGIGGHGHLDWGETPVPFVVWGAGAVPGAVGGEPASVLDLARTLARLLGVEAPAGARGRALVPVEDDAVAVPQPGRPIAVITAFNEAPVIERVVSTLPEGLDVLVVDDGSTDATAEIARAAGARVVSHPVNRGLGAALRTGLEIARDEGYAAALYLDGDLEYDPAQAERVLRPVLEGRAQYVLGSRFLGNRAGMSWHRQLANRASSALMGVLTGGRVVTDGQTGYRAFGRAALEVFEIRHDYNYAQVLTLALHQRGIDPLEVPIDYVRRRTGRSFVRYGEYARRVVPAVWRQLRSSDASRPARATSTSELTTVAHTESVP
jgi:CTP:molybdopterin cytidylyltransferase MocA